MKSAISSDGQSVGLRRQSRLGTSAPETERCTLCNARVLWAFAEGTRRVALSPEPTPLGEFLLLAERRDGKPVVHRLGRHETFPVFSYFFSAHAPKCRGGR